MEDFDGQKAKLRLEKAGNMELVKFGVRERTE